MEQTQIHGNIWCQTNRLIENIMYNFHKKEAPSRPFCGGLAWTGGASSGHEFPAAYQNLIDTYKARCQIL